MQKSGLIFHIFPVKIKIYSATGKKLQLLILCLKAVGGQTFIVKGFIVARLSDLKVNSSFFCMAAEVHRMSRCKLNFETFLFTLRKKPNNDEDFRVERTSFLC